MRIMYDSEQKIWALAFLPLPSTDPTSRSLARSLMPSIPPAFSRTSPSSSPLRRPLTLFVPKPRRLPTVHIPIDSHEQTLLLTVAAADRSGPRGPG